MEVTYIPVRGHHRRKGLLVESDTEHGTALVLDQASLKFVSCPLAGVKEASEHYTEAAYHEGMATAFRAAAARVAPLVEAFAHVCRERDEAEGGGGTHLNGGRCFGKARGPVRTVEQDDGIWLRNLCEHADKTLCKCGIHDSCVDCHHENTSDDDERTCIQKLHDDFHAAEIGKEPTSTPRSEAEEGRR